MSRQMYGGHRQARPRPDYQTPRIDNLSTPLPLVINDNCRWLEEQYSIRFGPSQLRTLQRRL